MRFREIVEDLFHGSPHKFNKFSLDHIGSGEGNQVYGWGLYFADRKEVAQWYQKNLAKLDNTYIERLTFSIDGMKWQKALTQAPEEDQDNLSTVCARLLDEIKETQREWYQSGYEDPLQRMIARAKESRNEPISRTILDIVSRYRFEINGGAHANLYHVEIPSFSSYLLWDTPFRMQDNMVKKAAKELLQPPAELQSYQKHSGIEDTFKAWEQWYQERFGRPFTGADLYKAISVQHGGDKKASKLLAQHGVPGVKYLNGVSRYQNGQNYNYVVFDDSLVTIKHVE